MRIKMTKEWCLAMAEREGTCEIGVGFSAFDPEIVSLQREPSRDDTRMALGRLVRLLRRERRLSLDRLADEASLAVTELRSVEEDPSYVPEPRTVYALSEVFGLSQQRLMQVAGLAVMADTKLREETVRFAAKSNSMEALDAEEKAALQDFVAVLSAKHR
jgi:transcriptional regulator with XRE-family HTH domain